MRIGLDLGGTNLRAGVVDDEGQLVRAQRAPIGAARDPAAIVELVAGTVAQLADGTPLTVGIGLAAMLRDRAGTVANSPHLGWRDVPFGALLAARLPGARVRIVNDVNAIAYGETIAGAARGCRDVLVVFVGTGIGGGLVVDGELVEGATSCAGEIGHVKVRWDAEAAACACGQRGCLEAYVGGSYVRARLGREPSELDADDPPLWAELAQLLGVALGNAIALVNCERLVLGGGFLGRAPKLLARVAEVVRASAPRAVTEALAIVPARLGDDAGIVGAAALAALR